MLIVLFISSMLFLSTSAYAMWARLDGTAQQQVSSLHILNTAGYAAAWGIVLSLLYLTIY